MKKVFVTTICFNSTRETLECLESLGNIKKNGFELFVVVIDNASEEKFSTDKIYRNFKLKILRSGENSGFSGGQNLGIKYALSEGAEYVVILNNDTEVDKNLINNLLSAFKQNVGIVAPKVYFAVGFEFHKERYKEKDLGKVIWYGGGIIEWKNVVGRHRGVDEVDKGQFSILEETEYASGCCMIVKREVFEKTGFFDDKYFLYYEDVDFCIRAKKDHFKILFQPKALLWHKNAASAGGSGSPLQDYYITRNRLLFGFRYAPLRTKLALIKESLRILIGGRSWQKRGILDFYLQNFGKGSFKKSE